MSQPMKTLSVCFIESLRKTIKNGFYFIWKSSFHSKDFSVFVMTFWSSRKNSLIRNIRLISEFMMSQPGQQIIVIHILPNISQNKSNQTMKFGQN